MSCCSSTHDENINNKLYDLLTYDCIGLFENIQDIFCLACNAGEMFFANKKTKTIEICYELAKAIWKSDNLNNVTTGYDTCGYKTPYYFEDLTNKNFIIPSQVINIFYFLIFLN